MGLNSCSTRNTGLEGNLEVRDGIRDAKLCEATRRACGRHVDVRTEGKEVGGVADGTWADAKVRWTRATAKKERSCRETSTRWISANPSGT